MIQLTAIVGGRPSVMLTGNTPDEAARSCKDRFGARFEGFAPIPASTMAKSMWAEYKSWRISRDELEVWLSGRDDEQEIRKELNRLRG